MRAARASSVLDVAAVGQPGQAPDPALAGALRVAQALEGGETALVSVWQRAPLQAMARLHMLAAADLVADDQLGRPRATPDVASRLDMLAELMTGGSRVPAPVLAAVAHGELLTLAPFGSADGVVARAVARLVTISTGLDPHGLGVPEVYWMRRAKDYRVAALGFSAGTADGLRQWILTACKGMQAGAREAVAIADASADT